MRSHRLKPDSLESDTRSRRDDRVLAHSAPEIQNNWIGTFDLRWREHTQEQQKAKPAPSVR